MVIQNDNLVTTQFDPGVPCVHQVWQGFASSEKFREATRNVIKFVQEKNRQYPKIQFLVDARKLGALSKEDVEWAAKEADPVLYKAGMRKIAFIMPEKVIAELTLKNYQRIAENTVVNQMESQLFSDEAVARKWLKS